MIKVLIVFATIVFGLAVVVKVNAQTITPRTPNLINRLESRATKAAANQSQRLERIKIEAGRLIENRITSLNKLLQRVTNNSGLSPDEKSSLSSQIQLTIDSLNTLRAKIDADTDADTAKTDAKTIITNYYIYKMFIPKIRLLLAIDNLQALSVKLSETSASIQNLINTLENEGKDTSVIQGLLDDMNSQLSIINTTLANDKTKLETLSTTSDFQTVFVQIRKDMAEVRSNFAKIRNDIAQMRTNFRGIRRSTTAIPTP